MDSGRGRGTELQEMRLRHGIYGVNADKTCSRNGHGVASHAGVSSNGSFHAELLPFHAQGKRE